MSSFRRARSHLSVGKALPGMQDLSKNASSAFRISPKTVKLLKEAAGENGCVKVEVKGEELVGNKVFRLNTSERPWQEKLDALANKVDDIQPCVFVLVRKARDVLLIKYIPDKALTKMRMLYASSMSSLKVQIEDCIDDVRIEEYNVSEVSELSQEEYFRNKNYEAPLTEQELARQEQDEAPTAGAYSLLARLTASSPVRLPGLGGSTVPSFLNKPPADDKVESSSEAEDSGSDSGSDSDSGNDDEDNNTDEQEQSDEETSEKEEQAVIEKKVIEKKVEKVSEPEPEKKRPSIVKTLSSMRSSIRKSTSKSATKVSGGDGSQVAGYPYTYETLVKMRSLSEYDDGMNPASMEIYMVDEEFEKVFKMSKEAFAKLPLWRRKLLKKNAKLF